MQFTKMQGAGNDYIYMNCFEESVSEPESLAIAVSDRHFGVGADGLVLICPSAVADVKMRIFNADGSEAKMCGNASRCVAKYAYEHGLAKKNPITLETNSGIKTITLLLQNDLVRSATVQMGAPILEPKEIPCRFPGTLVVGQPLQIQNETYQVTCVSMGNPHCVTIINEDPNAFPLETIGPLIENHPLFPDRVNAEFVRVTDPLHIQMRVWERGSGETLACGTGACAAVVACCLLGLCKKDTDIAVALQGGTLIVRWNSAENAIYKTGPAAYVCEGTLLL